MTTKLGFHIPVTNPYLHSLWERLEESADYYLALTNKVATVVSPINLFNTTKVTVKETPWTFSKCIGTACKIVSYATLILPVIALFLKMHRKHTHHYTLQNQSPIPSNSGSSSTNQTSNTANSTSTKTKRQNAKKKRSVKKQPAKNKQVNTGNNLSKGAAANVILVDDGSSTDDDDPSSATLTSKVDLLRSGRFLEHCTIIDVVTSHRNTILKENQTFFFVQRINLDTIEQDKFNLILGKSTPPDMKEPYPKKGGLALSIHSKTENHFTGLFVDFANHTLVYYDPLGSKMGAKTKTLIEKVQKAVFDPKTQHKVSIIDLKIQNQRDGYNCGRYVTRFFLNMVNPNIALAERISFMQRTPCSEENMIQELRKWIETYSIK